jgi:hypothetical protein
MIAKDIEAEIVRLFHGEKWPVGTIASQLGVHHTTVQRVLRQSGGSSRRSWRRALRWPTRSCRSSPSSSRSILAFGPAGCSRWSKRAATRAGPITSGASSAGIDPARRLKRSSLRTLPVEQAQVDWAHFGKLQVSLAERVLWAFVMVLSYSRRIFLRFYLGASMPFFLRGHIAAFDALGVARVLLYDNLKAPCSSATATPSASTPCCSRWPRTTASNHARWRWGAATKRDV